MKRTTKARWERAELDRSRERGAWDRWGVQDAELLHGWLRFSFQKRRIYAPLEHVQLPHYFARVGSSEAALLRFVQEYGRLGWQEAQTLRPQKPGTDLWLQKSLLEYSHLVDRRSEPVAYAEPLDWIRAHAQTVRWCLAAGHALRLSPGRMRTQRCTVLSHELPSPMGRRESIRPTLRREKTIDDLSPVDFVGGMLEEYLWINLQGVSRRVTYTGEGRIRSVWGGDSLLESIYTLVADVVTGGRLAQCLASDCGAIFLQTHEARQYCPPRDGQDKSACMNRLRVRRQRQKKQEETTDAKATRTR